MNEDALRQSGNRAGAMASSAAYSAPVNTMKTQLMPGKSAAMPMSTPTATQPSVQGNSVIDALRSRIGSLSAPSAEEQLMNDQLLQFRGDATSAVMGLEGQGRGITTDLIRGQQGLLNRQNQTQEQTLLDRIAATSAHRTSQLTAAQNEYSIAKDEQARQDALTAPTSVGNSILRFNPSTGQYETLYTAPETAKDQTAMVQEYEYARQNGYSGSFLNYQADANAANSASSSGADTGFSLSSGQTRYDAQGNAIAGALVGGAQAGGAPINPADWENTNRLNALIKDLLSADSAQGLRSAVGAKGSSSLFGIRNNPFSGTQATDFQAKVDSLVASLSLDNIDKLKGTGAISDPEQKMLREASTSLSTRMSEVGFLEELKRIQSVLSNPNGSSGNLSSFQPSQTYVQNLAGVRDSSGQTLSGEDIDYLSRYATQLQQSGKSTAQIDQELNSLMGFNKVGGDTNQAAQVATKKLATFYPKGSSGGQCGRFVNDVTGLAMGDSYASKMRYVDPSIGKGGSQPQAGDAFVMPYKSTGHTGIVASAPIKFHSDGSYDIYVIDSNFKLDEKVDQRIMNSKNISGYARVPWNPRLASLSSLKTV